MIMHREEDRGLDQKTFQVHVRAFIAMELVLI
jgi:hypothetical protein